MQYLDNRASLNMNSLNILRVMAKFWDYFSALNPGMTDPIWVGFINALKYNR